MVLDGWGGGEVRGDVVMRFHDSIHRPESLSGRKLTKRETVLSLMRLAGFENDEGKFVRLLVENPISRTAANEAWKAGRAMAARKVGA